MVRSSLIEVVLRDGSCCRLAPKALDLFLGKGRVSKFRRSDGWAIVGEDPIRSGKQGHVYEGPERRARGPVCLLSQIA